MRLLTRYMLVEVLTTFLFTLGVVTLGMLFFFVIQEAIRQGLGPLAIARILPYVLPNALLFAVPATVLFSACSVYGRASADNELVAVKSLGVAPMSMIWPVLGLAFVLSLITVWLNDVAVSWGRQGVYRVVLQSAEEIAYGTLRTQRSYSTRRFSINVKGVEGRTLIEPTLVVQGDGDSPPVTLTAQRAQLVCRPENQSLTIVLENGEMDVGDQAKLVFPDTLEHDIPLSDTARKADASGVPSQYPLWQIPAESRRQRDEIQRIEQLMASEAAYQMLSGDLESLTVREWDARYEELNQARQRLYRLQVEPWRRWANGFSCLCFVMVGVPVAIRLRTADLWTSFALCFMPILGVYYPLMAFGVDRAKAGDLPPYFVWMGNAILIAVGYWFLRRTVRY
jgi:lipopolysaccharide export system permease protein